MDRHELMGVLNDYCAEMPRNFLISIWVSVLCTVVFILLNFWYAVTDHAPRVAAIAAAVNEGLLDTETHPFALNRDKAIGIWSNSNNECMILYMLIDDNPNRLAEMLSPRVPDGVACLGLVDRFAGRPVMESYYHRYLHGYRVLTAGLMSVLSLSALPLSVLPIVLRNSILGMVTIGGLIALWGLHRDPAGRLRHAGNLAIGTIFLFIWGLSSFGTSISFAFGDAAVIAVWLVGVAINPLDLTQRAWVSIMAALGAFIAYVEFLTGQIPLALALLPGMVAIGLKEPTRLGQGRQRVCGGLLALATGVLTTILLKQLAVLAVFGQEAVFSFVSQLGRHTGGPVDIFFSPRELEFLTGLGIGPDSLGGVLASLKLLVLKFAISSLTIGMGSRIFGVTLIIASIIVLAVRLTHVLRSPMPLARGRGELLLVSLVVLAAWYFAMTTHAIQHSYYMIRPLVWLPVAAVISLLIPTRWDTIRAAASDARISTTAVK